MPDPVTSSIPPLNPSRYFTSLDPTSTTDGLPSQTKQTWHISNKSTDITLIAGLSVSLGILTIFAFAALLLWWCRRVRKNSIGGTWDPRSDASTAPPPSSPPLSPPASASVSMHKVCHEGQWVLVSQHILTTAPLVSYIDLHQRVVDGGDNRYRAVFVAGTCTRASERACKYWTAPQLSTESWAAGFAFLRGGPMLNAADVVCVIDVQATKGFLQAFCFFSQD